MGSHWLAWGPFNQLHLCQEPGMGENLSRARLTVVLSTSPKFSSGRRRRAVTGMSRVGAAGLESLTRSA